MRGSKIWKKLGKIVAVAIDLKFYFLHIKSNEVGTTLKDPETINGNVKNLMKMIENKR